MILYAGVVYISPTPAERLLISESPAEHPHRRSRHDDAHVDAGGDLNGTCEIEVGLGRATPMASTRGSVIAPL